MNATEVELAISLVGAAVGSFLLLLTSGSAGGFVVQPRKVKGIPTGPGVNLPAEPAKPPADKPADKPPGDGGGNGGGGQGQGGGGQGGGGGGGQGDGQGNDIPQCLWDMLPQATLAKYAEEAMPYATARTSVPYPIWNVQYNQLPSVMSDLPVGSFGYYVTSVVYMTLIDAKLSHNEFAQGDFFFPGCQLPAGAFAPVMPLGKLYLAWKAGA